MLRNMSRRVTAAVAILLFAGSLATATAFSPLSYPAPPLSPSVIDGAVYASSAGPNLPINDPQFAAFVLAMPVCSPGELYRASPFPSVSGCRAQGVAAPLFPKRVAQGTPAERFVAAAGAFLPPLLRPVPVAKANDGGTRNEPNPRHPGAWRATIDAEGQAEESRPYYGLYVRPSTHAGTTPVKGPGGQGGYVMETLYAAIPLAPPLDWAWWVEVGIIKYTPADAPCMNGGWFFFTDPEHQCYPAYEIPAGSLTEVIEYRLSATSWVALGRFGGNPWITLKTWTVTREYALAPDNGTQTPYGLVPGGPNIIFSDYQALFTPSGAFTPVDATYRYADVSNGRLKVLTLTQHTTWMNWWE